MGNEAKGFWVRFSADGIPAWFGPAHIDGAEWVDGVTYDLLITHRRTDQGDWVVRDPVKVEPPDPAQIEAERQAALEAERAAALARVKNMTAAARNMVFTDLPGQDAIYLQKRVEAGRYLAEKPKALDGFPFLAAEVGVTAPDAYQLAQLWLNRGHMFEVIGAMTEGARLTATNAIAAARKIEELGQAEAAFAAALVKMGVAQ